MPRAVHRLLVLVLAALLSGATLGAWALAGRPAHAPDVTGRFSGAAYQPYRPGQSPTGAAPGAAEIEEDLALLSRHLRAVRTYSSLGALAALPAIADRHGLEVVQGIWVDRDPDRSRREIEAGVEAAASPATTRLLVGNEAVLRGDLGIGQVAAYMQEVRERTGKPVSTAEPWAVWLKSPQLADHADFIAIHVLPYWEDTTTAEAVAYALDKIRLVQAAFPGKPVIVAEIGWPSDGRARWGLEPGLAAQARFVRTVLDATSRMGLDTFLMEAFDGPWKYTIEGSVGPYWGVCDAARRPKFPLAGPIETRPGWPWLAAGAVLVGLGALWFLWRRSPNGLLGIGVQAAAAFALASVAIWILDLTFARYFTLPGAAMWLALLALLGGLALVLMAEVAEMGGALGRPARRLAGAGPRRMPPASIHVPVHREPPEVVAETLRALARLDWPDFEVIVVDNNTPEEALWRPVEAECAHLNETIGRTVFRFVHVEGLRGFKAGALNMALRMTRPDAALVGVIDADYVVDPRWLARAVPHFDDPGVGFVQAPQDHRDTAWSAFKRVIGWEYAGFFHVGMVLRDLDHAIIQHGTMVLIRRAALESVGGWAEWCITEDAELGFRLHAAGWRSAYIRESLGCGLLPDDWGAYARQRHRWAYGGMRILRRCWRLLLPGSTLAPRQRLRYFAGWLPWLGDALGLAFAALSVVWTGLALAVPDYIELPDPVLFVPAVAAFAIRLALSFAVHRACVPCRIGDSLRAALAGLALAPTVGFAVLHGLIAPDAPFRRTPKAAGAARVRAALAAVRAEMALAAALLAAAAATLAFAPPDPGVLLWAGALALQAVPALTAVALSLVACRPPASSVPLPASRPSAAAA